jgi:CubicO group peptidase (beta-lactamase class C family)
VGGEVLSDEGIARVGELAASVVEDGTAPGLAALVACGDQVHVEAHGLLSISGDLPVQRDSLFRIASTTKPIVAAAALALVAEGLIDLDEPVGRSLPELAEPRVMRRMDGPIDDTVGAVRPITPRQLLTFTFGFGVGEEMFMSPEEWPIMAATNALPLATFGGPRPGVQPDPDGWMAAFASLPLMAQPGERWLYNTSASVLGVLLARAAGARLGEVLRSRIFEPLGMHDTAFFASDSSRLGTAYRPTPDGLEVNDPPDGEWSSQPAFEDGAAGLVSTVDDLLAFARMLLSDGDPVLDGGAVRAMTSDQLTDEQKSRGLASFLGGRSWGFGLSVAVEGEHAGAFGWDGGLGTSWYVDPAHDLVVIVLTQRMFEEAVGPQFHRDLREAAYAALA